MVSEWVTWSTLTMSHKPLFLDELSTSRIDPLLIGVVLAKKHIGDVLLAEAQPLLTLDQCFDVVGNRHKANLHDCGEGGDPSQ